MSLLRKITFPISLIYALVVYLRNKFFDIGLFTSKQFLTPTICIGNLSVGGTGKTPMVEYLIRLLGNDFKTAVLSRGYRRRSKGFLLASPLSTVEDLGDEPFQIHSKFPQITVAVDTDRRHGISQLEKEINPDVILLDDAFQHRKVKAALSILLTSYDSLYVDDWYLPTGDLRDSKSQASRADYIVVTKCPNTISSEERNTIIGRLAPNTNQRVLFSGLKYDHDVKSVENNLPLDDLKGRDITLVTGIAKPEPLIQYLNNKGLSFDHLAFNDHHFFTPKELRSLNTKALILTTEKDFMRLQGKVENMFYLGISHAFLADDGELLKVGLDDFMKQNP